MSGIDKEPCLPIYLPIILLNNIILIGFQYAYFRCHYIVDLY